MSEAATAAVQARALFGLVDYQHLTSLGADVSLREAFAKDWPVVGRYIEAIDAGNIELVTPEGEARVIPFTAGQNRIMQFVGINAAGTTVTAVIVGY